MDLLISQGKGADAVSVSKDLASKFPDNLAVQVALARSHIAAGETSNATSVLQGATRLAEYDPGIQVGLGRLQLVAGNFGGATYNVQKALQGRPDDPNALALAVEIELRRGDFPRADVALRALVSKHPNNAVTLLTTANVAMAKKQYEAAVSGYRALFARVDSVENALNVTRALMSAGEPGKAAAFLEGVAKSRPPERRIQVALAEMRFRAGQFVQARDAYLKVLAADPDDAETNNNLANLLLKMDDAASQQYAERAVKLAPNNAAFADTLGWILVRKGQIDAGLRYLREARLRIPGDPEIRYHLAYALAKSGRTAEAKTELLAALGVKGRADLAEDLARLKDELKL